MSEDLRSLSWFDVERRLAMRDVAVRERDYTISQQFRTIESLRSELRAAQDSLAKLEAKNEAEPIPTFEVGKCYIDGDGEFWGPLELNSGNFANTHPLRCRHGSWTLNGICHIDGKTKSQDDLLPGAVEPPPTWTPPASMPPDTWKWTNGRMLSSGAYGFCQSMRKAIWHDWTDPPREGLWQVKDGKATYLGES